MVCYPGGETFIILADGTTRLYDPSIDYSKLKLDPPPVSNSHYPLPKDYFTKIKARGIQSSTFNVTYNNFSSEAQTAFQYAIDIWASSLNSSVPITVYASWEPMAPGVLGSSTRQGSYRDFAGAHLHGVYYPGAIAEAISGTNLNGTGWEIYVRFNSNFSWYLGTDGNPGTQYDFVGVVMHELCHGVGFYSSFSYSGGTGYYGASGYPWVWDVDVENGAGDSLVNNPNYPNYSTELGTQITSNNVFYDNINSVDNNNGTRISIYAPATWNGGSSMSHVGEIFNSTRNSLMTYSIAPGEAEHSPGPVVLGMLKDMGWSIANIPPIITALIPDFSLAENSSDVYTIRLSSYIYDANVYALDSFQISSSGNVIVEIRNDSLFLTATPGFNGIDTIYLTAVDSAFLSVSDTFTVTVNALPAVTGGVIYAAGTPSSGGLVTLNSGTGSGSVVGATGYSDIKGLAIHPTTNFLYGIYPTGTYSKLIKIDPTTGVGYDYRIISGANYRDITFDTNEDLYINTSNGVIFKVDFNTGDTTRIGSTGISNLYAIDINPLTGQMWGLNSGGALYKINKQTATATLVKSPVASLGRSIAFDAEGRLYGLFGGSNQPLYSIDTVTGNGTLIGLTGRAGLSALSTSGITIGINEPLNTEIPDQFNLYACYPNPFNPSTTITFDVPKQSKVEIKVYNILGQEVRTLVNSSQSAGRKTVLWDGKNNEGAAVSSGLYMYRLITPNFTKTMKMMLMK